MADGDQSSDDRTEAATQRHLEEAREEGQVPLSREVVTFASLSAVVLVLGFQTQALMQHLLPNLIAFLSQAGRISMLESGHLRLAVSGVLSAILPVLCAALFAGAAAVLLQTNFGGILTIGGAQVGQALGQYYLREDLAKAAT